MRWHNHEGFTYVEQLIGLSIVSFIVLLLTNLFLFVQTDVNHSNVDVIRFLNHVNQDVKEAETIRWHNEALEIVIDGAVISYELRMESRIQRFKDKKGLVIVLDDVSTFHCSPPSSDRQLYGQLHCSITLETGQHYKRLFVSTKEWVHAYQTIR
ncbi:MULTISPECIES: competence type IV pilus minor pilin ComGF [Shouchella]|nr:competence type IV pilus minor pilin ComGF [Shouchella miscanthi]GAF24523.1 late competence protein ComGE [Bacillus sp. JCM 19047]